jgi:serine/threonine protein kinase
MEFEKRWQKIEQIGEGGQGIVYRVLDRDKFDFEKIIWGKINSGISGFTTMQQAESKMTLFKLFREGILDIINTEDQTQQGALKILHQPQDSRDSKNAEGRLKKEIKSMQSISHPNLLRILDSDPDDKWFVSYYHPKGTLTRHLDMFKGNFAGALKAFRALVEGVSELHKLGQVHRDIKPQNVFLDLKDNLILGDFGLIHFTDQQHSRISATWDNVGSRDWQPGWSLGIRIEDIKPSFDVFCLGKLLWSMISAQPVLQLWYFDRPKFDIEKMFPNSPYIRFANTLFAKCIVENEEDCLPDATALLREIDTVLSMIATNADLISPQILRCCKVCGLGNYKLIIEKGSYDIRNFGISPAGDRSMKVFACEHCGNVQLFAFGGGLSQNAWNE